MRQSEFEPDDAVASKTESCSIAQVRKIVSVVRHMHSAITIYRILRRIVSPLNVSHHLSFDNSHRNRYDSVEETSKAKGDTGYADRF